SGMAYAGLPFSGEMDFVETSYVFPITHMVAPKNKALACSECHAKNGRLAHLTGFYMPGRDVNRVIQYLGWTVVFGSLAGVFIHGLGRFIARGGKER
ncbi:MAG: cytochrome C, partial [Deltaproteobacteria bacterium]